MRRILTATAVAATLAVASVAAPQRAEAHCHGCGVAAGVVGGLAAGAIIGSALAGPRYYGPGYGYYAPGPVYYGPHCYWTRERWWNGWRWHTRRVRVCN
jgi:hypothetical protein